MADRAAPDRRGVARNSPHGGWTPAVAPRPVPAGERPPPKRLRTAWRFSSLLSSRPGPQQALLHHDSHRLVDGEMHDPFFPIDPAGRAQALLFLGPQFPRRHIS